MRFQDIKFKVEMRIVDSKSIYDIVHEETGLRQKVNLDISLHTKFHKHMEIYAKVLANEVIKHYKKKDTEKINEISKHS